MTSLGAVIRPELQPSHELQKLLTHSRNADEPTLQHLNSLSTPHATAWLSSPELIKAMSQGEFVSGTRVPTADGRPTLRVACSYMSTFRLHFPRHSVLRDTVSELTVKAGIPATTEQRLPESLNRRRFARVVLARENRCTRCSNNNTDSRFCSIPSAIDFNHYADGPSGRTKAAEESPSL